MHGQGVFLDKDSVKTGVFAESKLNGLGVERFVNQEIQLKGDFTSGILNG